MANPNSFVATAPRSASDVIKQPFVFCKALADAYVALAKAKPGAQTERA
jgi:hypothetical protein